jgi:hypothetical protein
MTDYDIAGADELAVHHFYRAMAWLGEELDAGQQAGATGFVPRTIKDVIEEQLFARRRDLFSKLSVVFLDTTSLAFTGAGGETLGEHGYSKEHRPDLLQMIDGRPICSEMWPGNTADVSVLVPVIDRLRTRFGIGRVCVVADRGMISAPTIAALEERGLEYVLGVCERTDRQAAYGRWDGGYLIESRWTCQLGLGIRQLSAGASLAESARPLRSPLHRPDRHRQRSLESQADQKAHLRVR